MTRIPHLHLRWLLTWIFSLILTSALLVENGRAVEKTIRFAPLPMENRETLVKQYRPLTIFLSEKLGTTINFDFSDNYSEIIKKFIEGKIDLAYFGPLPYVELKARYDKAEPLVHFNESSGKPMYTCAIISLADQIIPLKGLENKKVALTQPLSTCGYLSVNGLLQQNGSLLENNRYTYLGKHDAVALAVVRGEYDLGGIKTAIANKYIHMGLSILAETAPMPSFSLVANRATLSEQTMQTLCKELTQLDPNGKDKEMLKTWGENISHGTVKASDLDYEVVRRFKGNLEIPTQNKD
jgi:phosphonate transport system substrate-binding protein